MTHKFTVGIGVAVAALVFATSQSHATVFSFDEFYIEKNGSEIFRDSFNQYPPASGPDDAGNSSGVTYTVFGGGFVTENVGNNGRLFVDSELGGLTSNPNGDARLFNRLRRQRSTNPASSAVLDEASSWSVSTVLDLGLPTNPGEAFGLRIEDNGLSNPNAGNDRVALEVRRSNSTGNLGISFNALNFMGVPIESFDFVLLQPLLDSMADVDQILLSLSNAAGSNVITADFSLLDGGVSVFSQSLDNLGDTSLQVASVFSDEAYTRAAITTVQRAPEQIPEPGAVLLLAGGMLAFGVVRRRRRN